jgi:hypothetical protein
MTVFTVNDAEFGWEEIAAAAEVWREWRPFVEQTRQSLACLLLASETGRLPTGDEAREAATAFRYAHNLISADETLAWLRVRDMTADQWMDYLRCQLLRDRWANRLGEIVSANPVSDEVVAGAVKNHAICSGRFIEWARKLAGHAAIAFGAFGAAKSGLPVSAGATPLELIEYIEAVFGAQLQAPLSHDRLEARVADHYLDWVHYDCRYIWFPEERIAREAALCVTEDGLTLDEVAYDARSIVQQWDFYLDEIETNVRPYFLSARQGDWLGPMKIMEGFPLFLIVNKQMPALSDPRIRRRAEQSIIDSLVLKAINERVKWMI